MKNYQEFMDYVKENVADYLPEKFEQAEITVHQMVKNNDVMLDGLNIHDPDRNLSPNIYLNPLYEQYENGRDLDEIVAEVADIYVENMGSALTRNFQLNVEDIRNFEAVKDNIFPKLVNLEKNSSRLEHVPYTQKEDLAVTYHIKMTRDSRTLGSLMITDAMLEGYGVNKVELHALAMDNMGRLFPPTFQLLQEMMIELFADEFSRREGMPLEEAKEWAKEMVPTGGPELYCLSNECKINGAACIIDDNIQKMIAEKVGGDYFVLPSSVHEVLIMPKSEDMDPKELRNMVQDVNATQVAEGEILSDQVYEYDAKTHKLSICAPGKELKQEKGKNISQEPAMGVMEEKTAYETKTQEQVHEPIKHSGRSR